MNIFFKIKVTIITPALDGAILSRINRMSAIELLRHKGFEVVERRLTIYEIIEASAMGYLDEAFGTGTAVWVTMIQEIWYQS